MKITPEIEQKLSDMLETMDGSEVIFKSHIYSTYGEYTTSDDEVTIYIPDVKKDYKSVRIRGVCIDKCDFTEMFMDILFQKHDDYIENLRVNEVKKWLDRDENASSVVETAIEKCNDYIATEAKVEEPEIIEKEIPLPNDKQIASMLIACAVGVGVGVLIGLNIF